MYRVTLHCAPSILLLHLAFSSLFTFQRSFFPALLSPSHYALPFTVLFIRKIHLVIFLFLVRSPHSHLSLISVSPTLPLFLRFYSIPSLPLRLVSPSLPLLHLLPYSPTHSLPDPTLSPLGPLPLLPPLLTRSPSPPSSLP